MVLVISLGLTPYILSRLGLEGFGLWALAGSVVGYAGLMDFGLGTGFVKYIAEYAARGETLRVREVVTFGLIFYIAIGAMIALPVYLLAPSIVQLLKITPALRQVAANVFVLTVLSVFLSNALGVFGSLLAGLQHMRWISLVNIAGYVFFSSLVVVFLQFGYGIYGIVLANLFRICLTAGCAYIIGRKIFGPTLSNPFRPNGRVVRRLFGFGGWTQITSFSSLISMETDRVIIAVFLGVSTVGFYQIASKLALLVRFLPLTGLTALLPALSALDARKEGDKIDFAYVHGTRYLALATFGLAGFIAGAANLIVRAWIGHSLPYVTVIVLLLVATYAVNNLTGVGTTVVRAMGLPRYESFYAIVATLVNLVMTVALVQFFGLYGVVAGTAIGTIAGSCYFVWLFHRIRGSSIQEQVVRWLWRLLVSCGLATATLFLLSAMLPIEVVKSRLVDFLLLIPAGLIYAGCFAILLRITGFFEPVDLQMASAMLPQALTFVLESKPIKNLLPRTELSRLL